MAVIKKIKQEEHVLELSPEETSKFNLEEGDKFSLEITEKGALLKPYETIEFNLDDLSKDELIKLILLFKAKYPDEVEDFIANLIDDALNNIK